MKTDLTSVFSLIILIDAGMQRMISSRRETMVILEVPHFAEADITQILLLHCNLDPYQPQVSVLSGPSCIIGL